MKSKLVKCKTCGAEISNTAESCPHCGEKNGIIAGANAMANGCSGCLGVILAIFIVTMFIMVAVVNVPNGGSVTKKDNNLTISEAEFEALQPGMTYNACIKVIGCEGTLYSETTIGDISTTIYSWEGNGGIGTNASVIFQNGRLTNKTQFGLK